LKVHFYTPDLAYSKEEFVPFTHDIGTQTGATEERGFLKDDK